MKNLKKLTLVVLLCSTVLNSTFAQFQLANPNEYERNLAKYWLYRERLNQYFITGIGPNAGQSIPASERKLP